MKFRISVKSRVVIIGCFAVLVAGQMMATNLHPIARSYDAGEVISSSNDVPVAVPESQPEKASPLPVLQSAADHIVGQQCPDGGFGWPHADCTTTYHNITPPIILGVMNAYAFTSDASHVAAAASAGNYSLTNQYPNGEMRMGAQGPFFLAEAAVLTSNPSYSVFVEQFFDQLTAGTYGPDDRDTAGWIAEIVAYRQGAWINILPWEFMLLPIPAAVLGNPGQDVLFENAILASLNTLDNTDPATVYSDILGVAGAVRGLALRGLTVFPAIASPLHMDINGITTLENLAAVLAGYQNADGSWYWHSNLAVPAEGDKDAQTTAYAALALEAANLLVSANYQQNILDAQMFLEGLQLAGGGFESYPGGGVASANTEVEGEVLQALTQTPVPVELMSFSVE